MFNDFQLEHTFPVIGRRIMLLNGRRLRAGSHAELLVLAMEDVTERRRSEDDLKAIETYAQNIVDTVREPLLILDTTLRVRSGNRAFYQTFQVSPAETVDRLIYEHLAAYMAMNDLEFQGKFAEAAGHAQDAADGRIGCGDRGLGTRR